MGEVYRARDTRLRRSVAVKILPSEMATDARFRVRFDREAKVISSLNHPNICVLHDVGRENGFEYLVMELCEGQTLAERIARGPLPLDQVLRHGTEIAEALSAAHGAGIVHRDLKPSNVMLTKSGVKLLDFCLAKDETALRPSSVTTSTLDRRLSDDGRVLGTLPYMAPETVSGSEATARSDIFALGLVLYEMLTGKRAFFGTSKAALIAAILEHEPIPPRELRADVPAALEHVIEKCLAKSFDERWESAHDIAEELRWIRESRPSSTVAASPRRIAVVAAAAALVAIALVVPWRFSRRAESTPVFRLSIPLAQPVEQPGLTGAGNGLPNVTISSDGKRIAYVGVTGGVNRIYLRRVDSFETLALAGTDDAGGPFYSPDGEWIGFSCRGTLRKLPLAGGVTQTLTKITGAGRGATWAADGSIYFAPGSDGGLWQISASGVAPRKITKPNRSAGENSHRWPEMLPDGKHLLFTIRTDSIASFSDASIAVLSLETGKWNVVLEGGTCARYAVGNLIFGRGGNLYAAPFDLKTLTVTGPRRKVVDGVVTVASSGAAHFAISRKGDVVFVPGADAAGVTELLSVDLGGHAKPIGNVPLSVNKLRISPDGRKIALAVAAANDSVWLYDFGSGAATRVSFERGDTDNPVWTADSSRLIYQANCQILIKPAGGGDAEELLHAASMPMSCSRDGKLLAYCNYSVNTGLHLCLLPLGGDRKPQPLTPSRFNEFQASFSPDGRWIAYASDEEGALDAYVRPAAHSGGRWKISTDGGRWPHWSMDGQTLFYRKGDGFFSVPISMAGGEVRSGKPALLFSMAGVADYDVSGDGFVMARNVYDHSETRQLNMIVNWKP